MTHLITLLIGVIGGMILRDCLVRHERGPVIVCLAMIAVLAGTLTYLEVFR
jgi:mannitol-specific phosphotransferase system IIBC component